MTSIFHYSMTVCENAMRKIFDPIDPATDVSSSLELHWAEWLRAKHPSFDHARVDLTPFQPLKAKIDCIRLDYPSAITATQMRALKELVGDRLKVSIKPITTSQYIAIH